LSELAVCLLLSAIVFFVIEIEKYFFRRRAVYSEQSAGRSIASDPGPGGGRQFS